MNHSDLLMDDEGDPLVVDLTTVMGDLLSLQEEGEAEGEEAEYELVLQSAFQIAL